MNMLTDPNWLNFYIVVVGILWAALRWIIGHWKRKQMNSTLKMSRALLRLDDMIRSDCEVTFRSTAQSVTSNIYLLTLEIKNTGGEVITVSDYANNTKIGMQFGVRTKILEVSEKTPGRAIVQKGVNRVTIDPLDLGPRDALILDMLVTDFDGEVVEETRLLGTEQVLKVRVPTRPNLIHSLISVLVLLILPSCMFFYASSYALNHIFQTTIINNQTNQALGISVWTAGLIATLLSIGIIFALSYGRPMSMYSRRHELKVGKMRKLFPANTIRSAIFLFVFSPSLFFFSRELIMNTVFNFVALPNQDVALKIDYSTIAGGLITTVLLIVLNFFLSWWLPLREFDGE